MNNKGFTLIELLVVIAVLGVLAGGVLVAINPGEKVAQAKDSTKKSAVSQLVNALQAYYTLNGGKYPASNNTWIQSLVDSGELKNVPPPVNNDTNCLVGQNGYCYKTNEDQSSAIVYVKLESKSQCKDSSADAYFLWSSEDGTSGIVCSLSGEPSDTTGGYTFGAGSSAPTEGLVGWWKFDENTGNSAADSSGHGNTGTWQGSVPYWTSGKINSGGNFNGADNYISVADIVYGSSFSVGAWIKTSSVSQDGNIDNIVNEVGSSTNEGYQCSVSGESGKAGKIRLYISDNINSVNTYSAIRVDDGNWHHVVCIKDNNTAKIYIDGNTPDTGNVGSVSGITDVTTSGTRIGALREGSGQFFIGQIDDVRIYNRVLSETEIKALYQGSN